MMKKVLFTALITTSSFAIVISPTPSMAPGAVPPPAQQQPSVASPANTQIPSTATTTTPNTTSTTPTTQNQNQAVNLPPPPPQNVANQAFNTFAQQQPTQNKQSTQSPPPGNLLPLSSLIGNTTGTSTIEMPFIVYSLICHHSRCKALTNYGLVSKGQRISTHQYIKNITPYAVVVEQRIKIGKKIHREYHTYSLFEFTGNYK